LFATPTIRKYTLLSCFIWWVSDASHRFTIRLILYW
jgi:hypothetical protein